MATRLPRRTLNLAALLALLLVLAASLWAVVNMERTIHHGQPLLVQLAPVDPRSLMQGDYMALRFAIDRDLPRRRSNAPPPRRYAYVTLDAAGRARFDSLGDTLPAPPGRVALRIRLRDRQTSIGPNAFFFQEGHASIYERAQWGEFRVTDDGTALLVALRDGELQVLGEQRW